MAPRLLPWSIRVLWAALPVTLGPALGSALHPHSPAVRDAAATAAWVAWVASLVATLVPHPLGLTLFRCMAPAALVVAGGAVATGLAGPTAATVGVAWTALVVVVALLPGTAIVFVNGPAYPNERRFPLAVPGALLLGPLQLTWLLVVGAPVAALLLLAARQWAIGAAALLVAVGAAWLGGRALHGLSRRWLVFVPAGLVLHDPMTLADPVLFRRALIERLWPAPEGSDSLDLTQRAPGLALELLLREKVAMVRVSPTNRSGEQGSSARLLFTPTRSGAVLAEAARRGLPVDD